MEHRTIKFRAWKDGEMLTMPITTTFGLHRFFGMLDDTNTIVSQFTGLRDKNGKEIFEGDIIRLRKPVRTTQTHYGDNIPNGAYTEPMEAAIITEVHEIIFKDSVCGYYVENDFTSPLVWADIKWTERDIKDAININKRNQPEDWFSNPEEGDLKWLIEEAKVSTTEELIEYISGIEIIGNIYENPELI